jgi:hypothetical protein
VRDDWALIDFTRALMPNWLSKATSMKAFTAVALALMFLVIVLKAIA